MAPQARSGPPVSQLVREARRGAGLTLEECAERLGIHYTALSKYENASRLPSSAHLPTLAAFVGMPFGAFATAVAEERMRMREAPEPERTFLSDYEMNAAAEEDRARFLEKVRRPNLNFPRDRDAIPRVLYDLDVIYDPVVRNGAGKAVFGALYPRGGSYRDTTDAIAIATRSVGYDVAVSERTMTFHVLHEIGHYRLHWARAAAIVETPPDVPTYCSSDDRSGLEFQANFYASAFLVPAAEVRQLLGPRTQVHSDAELSDLADHFFVGSGTLVRRLRSLGISAGRRRW